jgi:hypothetical protein
LGSLLALRIDRGRSVRAQQECLTSQQRGKLGSQFGSSNTDGPIYASRCTRLAMGTTNRVWSGRGTGTFSSCMTSCERAAAVEVGVRRFCMSMLCEVWLAAAGYTKLPRIKRIRRSSLPWPHSFLLRRHEHGRSD